MKKKPPWVAVSVVLLEIFDQNGRFLSVHHEWSEVEQIMTDLMRRGYVRLAEPHLPKPGQACFVALEM